MRNDLKSQLSQWSDTGLSVALLLIGAALIGLAMIPKHHLEKAIVLAWVILP